MHTHCKYTPGLGVSAESTVHDNNRPALSHYRKLSMTSACLGCLFDINHNKIFFDPPSRVMEIKTEINKWDLIKLKSFCKTKKP